MHDSLVLLSRCLAGECMVPVRSELQRDYQCAPFKGGMTVFLKNEPALSEEELISIKSSFLKVIRNGMNSQIYSFGEIEETIFVGNRAYDSSNNDNSSSLRANNSSEQKNLEGPIGGSSNVRVGVLASALSAVILVLALLVARKVTRDRPKDTPDTPLSKEIHLEKHVCSHTKSSSAVSESMSETGHACETPKDEEENDRSGDRGEPVKQKETPPLAKDHGNNCDPGIEDMTITFGHGSSLLPNLDIDSSREDEDPASMFQH